MNSENKLLVCLYSDSNFLSINLLESLLSMGCYVNIVTEDIKGWTEKTNFIVARRRFSINSYTELITKQSYDYILFCSGFLHKRNVYKDLNKFYSIFRDNKSKTLIILPLETYTDVKTLPLSIDSNTGYIFLSDILGPRIDLESDLFISKCIFELFEKKHTTINMGEIIRPIFCPDVATEIVKWLFSFGPIGKEVLLTGPKISLNEFLKQSIKNIGPIKVDYKKDTTPRQWPIKVEEVVINRDASYQLKETFSWLRQKSNQENNKTDQHRKIKVAKNIHSKKFGNKIKLLLIIILVFLLFPVIDIGLSLGIGYVAYKSFKSSNENILRGSLKLVEVISKVGEIQSKYLSYIPGLNIVYRETNYALGFINRSSNASVYAIRLLNIGNNIVSSILDDKSIIISQTLSGTEGIVSSVYSQIDLLSQITNKGISDGSLLAKRVLIKVNFNEYKNLALQIGNIINNLPEILGENSPKTYLVLFQNNMELRPTGGFIGSYGLLTFDKGHMTDFAISDIYSADGQLKGHVEPPTAIRVHLGEANWWFRDSNWDPDFPTSAKRAEWFLDKEMDRKVDGVISVDLFPIKDYLSFSGPIYLTDYGINIDSNNLYEKVQSEVQDNFFPGTRKKASFLTALSRALIENVSNLNSSNKLKLLSVIYSSLEGRHIQVFLHNTQTQEAITKLRWDGSISQTSCGQGCYSDLVGLVEANVGMNKSNYFIERKVSLEVKYYPNEIQRRLIVTYKNSANPSLGVSGRYKNYLRLLTPQNVKDIRVFSSIGQNSEYLTPEIMDTKSKKEIGAVIEVLPGDTKDVVFTWSTKVSKPISKYGLTIRKQAGVELHPLLMEFLLPSKLVSTNIPFSLTDGGSYVYNTTLAKDIDVQFSF